MKLGKKLKKHWRHFFKRYGVFKIVSIILSIYILVVTFAPSGTLPTDERPDDGDTSSNQNSGETNGTEDHLLTENTIQKIILGITRASAFFMYPALVFVFTTKFRATMEFIQHTPFSLFTYSDLHELHIYCGWIILICGLIHTILHITRWLMQGNLNLLYENISGISGIVIITSTLFIISPMAFESLRKRMHFEYRKALHYLFIPFCIGLAFHAPVSKIPNGGFSPIIFPVLIVWYFLDTLYINLFMTEKITSTKFHVVPSGVQLTMAVSESFQKRGGHGGYCYVNFPWISRTQWHAFSLFENPSNPAERQIFIQDLGDWTHEIRMALKRDTSRPIWVQGPFSSPYDSAEDFDNQILVAGGIGITPAISVMRAHKDFKRSNLIWAVRDPHMLEFFLSHAEFSTRGWNLVFYTGKEALYLGNAKEITTSSGAVVHIIRSRPDFDILLPKLIYSIESGLFVPEDHLPDPKADAIAELRMLLDEMDREGTKSGEEKLQELCLRAEDLGFLFSNLLSDLTDDTSEEEMDSSLKTLAKTASLNYESTRRKSSLASVTEAMAEESSLNSYDSESEAMEEFEKLYGNSNKINRSEHSSNETEEVDEELGVIVNIDDAHQKNTKIRSDNHTASEALWTAESSPPSNIVPQSPAENNKLDSNHLPTSKSSRDSVPHHGSSSILRKIRRASMASSARRGSNFSGMSSCDLAGFSMGLRNRTSIVSHDGSRPLRRISFGMASLPNLFDKNQDKRFKPWQTQDFETAKLFVNDLDKETVLSTWGVLYCGGKGRLADAVRKSSKRNGLALAMESFAW